jgi:hypothetical protein
MWKEVVMAWFQALTLYLLEGTEENHIQNSLPDTIQKYYHLNARSYVIFLIGSLTSAKTNAVLEISLSFFHDLYHIDTLCQTNFNIIM